MGRSWRGIGPADDEVERSEARGEFERADSSIVDFVPRELNGEAGRRLWYAVLVSVEGDDDLSDDDEF